MKLPLLCLPLVSSRPQQLIHAAAHIYRLVYVQPAMWLLRHGNKGVVLTLLALLRHETVQKRLRKSHASRSKSSMKIISLWWGMWLKECFSIQ
jgi:hypothetical protein